MVALVTTFDKTSVWMINWFVNHYRNYGIKDFFISLHVDPDIDDKKEFVDYVENELSNLGCSLFSVYHAHYNSLDFRNYCDDVQKHVRCHHDWIVWSDSDELHEFDDLVTNIVSKLEHQGQYSIGGHLVDRFSRSNTLAPADKSISPWYQFPLAGPITQKVVSAWTCKIPLAHAHCKIRAGNHLAIDPNGTSFNVLADRFVVPVHHFKWHGAVVQKLEERVREYQKKDIAWWVESERALDWLKSVNLKFLDKIEIFDYEDDIKGEGPFSNNHNYSGKLPFDFTMPDGGFYI
jgi:hypothetical protein